jgi:hydroxymethylpyrimidine pyrophosphatase-like HAD family hydrolase
MIPFELSPLPHTWFIDLDGTILKHNGYLNGDDGLLPGVKDLWASIPEEDCIIIVTGREEKYKESSLKILEDNGLRYNYAIFGLPLGERIVVNDLKPGGLKTAVAWNVNRDKGFIL